MVKFHHLTVNSYQYVVFRTHNLPSLHIVHKFSGTHDITFTYSKNKTSQSFYITFISTHTYIMVMKLQTNEQPSNGLYHNRSFVWHIKRNTFPEIVFSVDKQPIYPSIRIRPNETIMCILRSCMCSAQFSKQRFDLQPMWASVLHSEIANEWGIIMTNGERQQQRKWNHHIKSVRMGEADWPIYLTHLRANNSITEDKISE